MGQIPVNVGSFDKYSYNGVTVYGTTMYFTIPENAGITGCSVTFVTHAAGGNTADRAFTLNGLRAHSSGSWAQAGTLDHTLLSTGSNAFRVQLKSTTPGGYTVCWWDISSITLTITYTDVPTGGGGTPPPPNLGAVSINKTTLTAGDTITVSASACDAVFSRSIYLMLADNTVITNIEINFGTAAKSWTVTVPESLCAAYAAESETLIIKAYMEVYQTGTYVGSDAKNFTMYVPASAVPTITGFTATYNANGVNPSITKYVQNYSKVNLLAGASGSLGSGIAIYEISGGGWYSATHNPTFGPFGQAGVVTFTVKATDTRGRSAYSTVSITVLSYGPAAFSNPEAWRSSDAGVKNQKGTYARLKSGVIYSSLDGQNSVTLKGRVYPKGGAVPAYTSMTPDAVWIAGGGLLLVTKTYIAQMEVVDLIGSRTIEFTIPTKKTGISIMARMQGIAFGKSAEIPGVAEFGWPIYNCPYEVGDILQTLNTSSPVDRWPGTEWEAVTGRVLVGIDSTQAEFDTAGEEGGSKTVQLGLGSGYAKLWKTGTALYTKNKSASWTSSDGTSALPSDNVYAGAMTQGLELGGTTDSGSNLQPYKVVYMWLRTA